MLRYTVGYDATAPGNNKNSSGDEIANVNFYEDLYIKIGLSR